MDDLFARAEARPLTVSQVNARARALLERSFASVTVLGEVSGHKVVGGHHYFALKDRDAQLAAVLFRREAREGRIELANGIDVLATGRLTVYSPQGRYQLLVDRVERRGAGALAAAFEELKVRLAAEGLFDPARKRRLPRLPRRVAVITSPTGAVIRDIVNVATRRWPRASILVVPTRVQGAEAALPVATAIEKASALAAQLGVDVLIVARGGGSLEDLWCFNDERVARAIFAASVPVVSAVGHETDFTIADFVADVRAPTPSAAAELVFPSRAELAGQLAREITRAGAALAHDLRGKRLHLRAVRAELGDARRLLREHVQRLAHLRGAQEDALGRSLLDRRLRLQGLEARLARLHPRAHLGDVRGALRAAERRIAVAARQLIATRRDRVRALGGRVQALSPLGVLERGYAIVHAVGGGIVRNADEVAPGDLVDVRVGRGRFEATVGAIRTAGHKEA